MLELTPFASLFPDATGADLALVVELWQSIAPASRAPTADWQKMLSTRQAARQAIAAVRAASTSADIAAVTPVWP
jgi:hypothetical protein